MQFTSLLLFFGVFFQYCPWIVHLSEKILNGDPIANDLLDPSHGNPFNYNITVAVVKNGEEKQEKPPQTPRFIRAMLYEVS
jgi:hypothetical protein